MDDKRIKEIYGEDWHYIANEVKAKANWTCQECGATRDLKRKIRITVHHEDGDPTNNARWNLKCLCNRCHLKKQKFLQAQYLTVKKEIAGQEVLFPKDTQKFGTHT
jgi:5-methylcytosine-specific restriction endonuclease McrA